MRAMRFLCKLQLPRWSMLVAPIFYLVFVLFILNLTFPLSSLGRRGGSATDTHRLPDAAHLVISDQQEPRSDVENKSANHANDVVGYRVEPKHHSGEELRSLKESFYKADLDNNLSLDIQEVARYINKRVRDHIQHSIRTNPINFAKIDVAPRDGLVSWDEYHAYFLREKGLPQGYIESHTESKHVALDRSAKEEMMRDKAVWNEAARTDSFSLTLDEFLAFRHPEASAVNLLSLVDDLLRQFDEDGDDLLTCEEFSHVAADDLDDKWRQYIVTKTVRQREEEFKRLMDVNKDGQADRSELLSYIDPRHPRHALQEAAVLFELADANGDKRLTLEEVMAQATAFIESKMIGTAESFHDEF